VPTVSLRFYAQLNDFLPYARRQRRFTHMLTAPASVKDTIEALGVPHPEVDLLIVNGEAADFARLLQDGDVVAVYPTFRSLDLAGIVRTGFPPPRPPRFALDAHLRKLASWLRLAGFDSVIVDDDAVLARVGAEEERVVLTRDVALLKRAIIRSGYWVRDTDPERQLGEVVQRFDLAAEMSPFTRCMECNGLLRDVEASAVVDRLAACTREEFTEFKECSGCGRVYWQGSHYARLRELLGRVVAFR
jgi:uncharacterized protein with PIN domain